MAKKALLMILDGWGCGDRQKDDVIFNTPTPHRPIHRNGHRQSQKKHCNRRSVDRQQDNEADIDQRAEVDTDRQVVEQKNLQQGQNKE